MKQIQDRRIKDRTSGFPSLHWTCSSASGHIRFLYGFCEASHGVGSISVTTCLHFISSILKVYMTFSRKSATQILGSIYYNLSIQEHLAKDISQTISLSPKKYCHLSTDKSSLYKEIKFSHLPSFLFLGCILLVKGVNGSQDK